MGACYQTDNDQHFTYYLHQFQQHLYLQKVLRDYKAATEHTEDSSQIVSNEQTASEHRQIKKHLQALEDSTSPLRLRMKQDEDKIRTELQRTAHNP